MCCDCWRAVASFLSERLYLTHEWTETLADLSEERRWPNPNWAGWLEWLKTKARLMDDPPMKRIVRDPKDDRFWRLRFRKELTSWFLRTETFWILKRRTACVVARHELSSRLS